MIPVGRFQLGTFYDSILFPHKRGKTFPVLLVACICKNHHNHQQVSISVLIGSNMIDFDFFFFCFSVKQVATETYLFSLQIFYYVI